MRRSLVLNLQLLLAFALAACASPDEHMDILPRGKFVQVLADMQLVEARLQQEMTLQPSAGIPADDHAQEVFVRHGTTGADFRRSFEHYATDNDLMASIYEDVIAELSQRKDSLDQVVDPR